MDHSLNRKIKKKHELTLEPRGKYQYTERVERGEIEKKARLTFRAFALLHSEKRRANDRIVIFVIILPFNIK